MRVFMTGATGFIGQAVVRAIQRRGWSLTTLVRPQMALAEPLLRALGLPAFLSRQMVDTSRRHLHFSSARADRELGWTHPEVQPMWSALVDAERRLMAGRRGFLEKLRHAAVVE